MATVSRAGGPLGSGPAVPTPGARVPAAAEMSVSGQRLGAGGAAGRRFSGAGGGGGGGREGLGGSGAGGAEELWSGVRCWCGSGELQGVMREGPFPASAWCISRRH